MYCLTIRDAHNNCWAKNYYFNTLEEANNWSNALCSLYDNKEAFEGYQWGISEVKSTKLTLDKFMKGHGLNKCRHTTIACPEYVGEEKGSVLDIDSSERDPLFKEAAEVIVIAQQGSASLLQRKLKLGYNRAGRIIDQMESAGIVGPFEGSKARQVLITDLSALNLFLNKE